MLILSKPCGEGGIRTPGTSQYNGFQDRRNRPLCHLSKSQIRDALFSKALQRYMFFLNIQTLCTKNSNKFVSLSLDKSTAMSIKSLIFLLFSLIFCPLAAQEDSAVLESHLREIRRNSQNTSSLLYLCNYYLQQGNYPKAITYAEVVKNQADQNKDDRLMMYAFLFQGKARLMIGRKTAQKSLEAARNIAYNLRNDSVLCEVYGCLGEYEAVVEADYYQAMQWMYKGIARAQKKQLDASYALLLSKLSHVYYLKRDGAGLKYAEESYEVAKNLDNPYLIYQASIESAYMYFLNKQGTDAILFLQEAEALMNENHFFDQAHTYNLLGNLLYDLGDLKQAAISFQKGMNDKQGSQITSVIYAHLGYAKVLMEQKKWPEAIIVLKHGIAISRARSNAVHRHELYQLLSICYEHQHKYEEALKSYKLFRLENDSLFSSRRELEVSEMRYRYDTERQKNQIKQGQLTVMEKEQKLQQLSFALILVVLVSGLIYYLYRRKNILYLRIVKQNQEAIRRESELLRRIESLQQTSVQPAESVQEKYASSSLTDEKSGELFRQLESLMRDAKLYRDNSLSKDKVAERLGTNRTYLSQIINEQTQMSFTRYVNAFRIDEAIRVLSDSTNDLPLKALASDLGFNSISTFYNLFQTAIGMTPAQYRSKVKELKKLDGMGKN